MLFGSLFISACGFKVIDKIKNYLVFKPFRILQLSDLHVCGSDNRLEFETQSKSFKKLLQQIEIINDFKEIDFLVLNGDFANKNPYKELSSNILISFIKDLIEVSIGNSNYDRLLVIPGNHDSLWDDFENNKLTKYPWAKYLELYSKIYSTNSNILKELGAWNTKDFLDTESLEPEKLCWSRNFPDFHLKFLGLVTPSLAESEKGQGRFHEGVREFIEKSGEDSTSNGEIRIALMHHDLFESISIHPFEEKNKIVRSGDAYLSLTEKDGRMVFSGHTHSANIISIDGSYLRGGQYISPGKLQIINTGTISGYHPTGAIPRSFNVIDFMGFDAIEGHRKTRITPYTMEPANFNWQEGLPFDSKI
jgi:3',5'-cyclic AMP phosphodiesterase CpdA